MRPCPGVSEIVANTETLRAKAEFVAELHRLLFMEVGVLKNRQGRAIAKAGEAEQLRHEAARPTAQAGATRGPGR